MLFSGLNLTKLRLSVNVTKATNVIKLMSPDIISCMFKIAGTESGLCETTREKLQFATAAKMRNEL